MLSLKYENCRKIKIKEIEDPLKKRVSKFGEFEKNSYLSLNKNVFITNQPSSESDKWHFGDAKDLIIITVLKLQCFQCYKRNLVLMRKDDVASAICA